jgi:hypothetical protein
MDAIPNAVETLARLQPNSLPGGFRKTPNVKTARDQKLSLAPRKAAAFHTG